MCPSCTTLCYVPQEMAQCLYRLQSVDSSVSVVYGVCDLRSISGMGRHFFLHHCVESHCENHYQASEPFRANSLHRNTNQATKLGYTYAIREKVKQKCFI